METVGFDWNDLSGLVFIFAIFAILGSIASFVFWLYTLIDCVRREHRNPNDKIVWILLIIFLHVLGSILYLVIQRPNTETPEEAARRAGPP